MADSKAAQIKALAAHFRKLGADDPEAWASSEINEDIPQFARFVFLKAAWSYVVPEENDAWISENIRHYKKESDAPYAGIGRALMRMQERGVSNADITELVRSMQVEFLFSICSLLAGAVVPEFLDESMPDVHWRLVDETGREPCESPTIDCLHESVLETDPTGREMRPRPESPKSKT